MNLNNLKLNEATEDMLEEINEIYLQCRDELNKNGIFQWDDRYPNKEYFHECIEDKVLFIFTDGSKIIGHVVLSEWESEEWESITWKERKPLIIHSLMIHPKEQNKGMGTVFVELCETLAIEKGYESIRLDAFSSNKKALHLYEKLGYEKRGSVSFQTKPVGHQEYICFEKKLFYRKNV